SSSGGPYRLDCSTSGLGRSAACAHLIWTLSERASLGKLPEAFEGYPHAILGHGRSRCVNPSRSLIGCAHHGLACLGLRASSVTQQRDNDNEFRYRFGRDSTCATS